MAHLAEACAGFTAALSKAEAELQAVACLLEEDFAARGEPGEPGPLDVLSRVHRLTRELPTVAREVTAAAEAKAAVVARTAASLRATQALLEALNRRAGIAAGGADAAEGGALLAELERHAAALADARAVAA